MGESGFQGPRWRNRCDSEFGGYRTKGISPVVTFMPHLNRIAVVVRPTLPSIHWIRGVLGDSSAMLKAEVLGSQGRVYGDSIGGG